MSGALLEVGLRVTMPVDNAISPAADFSNPVVFRTVLGWLLSGNPDPAGARVRAIRHALEQHLHIEAFFWEYAAFVRTNICPHSASNVCYVPCMRVAAMPRSTSTVPADHGLLQRKPPLPARSM